ncbi:MAG: GAF domain-containing protein [Lachnospiraceae bacterium]|nr:GAF domain-containing protein [Lachnospiraceae bacterium]
MVQMQAEKILEIGIQLTAERDYDELLSKIIDCAMELTGCDGGTLYIFEKDLLQFCILKNKSMGIDQKGTGDEKYPPVAMNEKNICAYAAIHREFLNIEDAYSSSQFDFSGPREYDKLTGYRTKSMLVFPLISHEDKLIGVVQLINAKNEAGEIIPFGEDCEKVLRSLGSQAAVAVANMRYVQEIADLMISITQVFTDAIDTRIPYNYYHSRNVYLYVKLLVDYINSQHEAGKIDKYYTPAERDELLMAALMHDIGKLVIPNDIIDKTTRLGDKLELVLERFERLSLLYNIDYLQGRISKDKWIEKKNYFLDARERVEEINRKPRLSEEDTTYIRDMAKMNYTDSNGQKITYLSLDEAECLTVSSGNLTSAEREVIRSHVEYTEKYLRKMNFGVRYPHIIEWAGAHHEFLNGTGYPRGLKGDEIPFEARILVVVDVFEALTSADRPYKKSMEEKKAFSVLEDMVSEGKVDGEVLALFKEAVSSVQNDLKLFVHHEEDAWK